ncbi:MAG: hypothetical protein DI538_25965, partial [Azospira oryzae]
MADIFQWDRFAVLLAHSSFSMDPTLRDIPAGTLALGLGDDASEGIALNCKNSQRYRSVSAWLWNFREGANKQVISSQADSLIKISRIWAD